MSLWLESMLATFWSYLFVSQQWAASKNSETLIRFSKAMNLGHRNITANFHVYMFGNIYDCLQNWWKLYLSLHQNCKHNSCFQTYYSTSMLLTAYCTVYTTYCLLLKKKKIMLLSEQHTTLILQTLYANTEFRIAYYSYYFTI